MIIYRSNGKKIKVDNPKKILFKKYIKIGSIFMIIRIFIILSVNLGPFFFLIYFDEQLKSDSFICECRAIHNDLETIPLDVFEEFVKPLARKEVLENLVAIRSKYEQIGTPLGEIRINWNKLEQDASRLEQLIEDKLDSIPPDHLIHIF